MMFREIKYLTEDKLFKNFIRKYGLKIMILNKRAYITSSCFVIEVYGFCTESHFYFDVYTSDLKRTSNIGRLLYEKDKSKLREIYEAEKRDRVEVLSENLETSQEITLKAERHFFTYIKVMDIFLADFLRCTSHFNLSLFDPVIRSKEEALREILLK